MKIESNERGDLVLKEVFSGIRFESPDGEELGVVMRDGGFEVTYRGRKIEFKRGAVTPKCEFLRPVDPRLAKLADALLELEANVWKELERIREANRAKV